MNNETNNETVYLNDYDATILKTEWEAIITSIEKLSSPETTLTDIETASNEIKNNYSEMAFDIFTRELWAMLEYNMAK